MGWACRDIDRLPRPPPDRSPAIIPRPPSSTNPGSSVTDVDESPRIPRTLHHGVLVFAMLREELGNRHLGGTVRYLGVAILRMDIKGSSVSSVMGFVSAASVFRISRYRYPSHICLFSIKMGQQNSRPVFDSKLTKSHVEHALIQQDGRHNDIPTVLATLLFLDASPEMLKHAYRCRKDSLHTWTPSPGSITDEATKTALLGDKRFQRAFMTYFSLLNNQYNSNSTALALSQLFSGPIPLVYGLFSSLGLPLTFLSDGIELRSAILVAQSLTLSAVDWQPGIYDLLTSSQLARPASELLGPEELLRRVAYDGRFSGVMKGGAGYHNISQILSNSSARTAVVEYVQQLDCRNLSLLLPQLASLSVLLLTATHKPERPAFDFYLAHLVTAVNSLRVVLSILEEGTQRVVVARGVWLLFVLVYVTQLRPVVDGELLMGMELQEGHDWRAVYDVFCNEGGTGQGRWGNGPWLRVMRTLFELGREFDGEGNGGVCLRGAWKMVGYWSGWTGLGGEGGGRDGGLNIRL